MEQSIILPLSKKKGERNQVTLRSSMNHGSVGDIW